MSFRDSIRPLRGFFILGAVAHLLIFLADFYIYRLGGWLRAGSFLCFLACAVFLCWIYCPAKPPEDTTK